MFTVAIARSLLIPKLHFDCALIGLPADIPAGVSILLDKFRPLVMAVVEGEFSGQSFFSWKPWMMREDRMSPVSPDIKRHIESLKLWGAYATPLMEAHGLGDFERHPVLRSRVHDIFDTKEHTFVIHS